MRWGFSEQLDPTIEDLEDANAINDVDEVRWLTSFLSLDTRKTYSLNESESPEAIRRAAERAGIPAGGVTALAGRLMPDGSRAPAF